MDNDLIEANEDEKDYNLLIESLEITIIRKI